MPFDPTLFDPLTTNEEFRRLAEAVRAGAPASVAGLVESSKALVLDLVRRMTGRPVMLVVPDDARLDEYARDLAAFSRLFGGSQAAARVLRFPSLGQLRTRFGERLGFMARFSSWESRSPRQPSPNTSRGAERHLPLPGERFSTTT